MLGLALYYDGTMATAEIDNIAVWHDSKTTMACTFTAPVVADPCIPSDPCDPNSPTGTWTQSYITSTPDTNEAIAQGCWLISCESTDRGIYPGEEFDISITTNTPVEGRYYLALHDRLRDEWVRFVHDEVLICDFDGDGGVTFSDFDYFADTWLQKGTAGLSW